MMKFFHSEFFDKLPPYAFKRSIRMTAYHHAIFLESMFFGAVFQHKEIWNAALSVLSYIKDVHGETYLLTDSFCSGDIELPTLTVSMNVPEFAFLAAVTQDTKGWTNC